MKAIFIAYDQAHHEKIIEILDRNNCRGFTCFGTVTGRGTSSGEPHYGSHAWPSLASAILTMVDDAKADNLLAVLHRVDEEKPKLGLRAFLWDIEKSI